MGGNTHRDRKRNIPLNGLRFTHTYILFYFFSKTFGINVMLIDRTLMYDRIHLPRKISQELRRERARVRSGKPELRPILERK